MFHAWKRKLKLRTEGSNQGEPLEAISVLAPVRVIGEAAPPTIAVELPGGIVVRIPASIDWALMRAAAQLACELARGVTGPC